MGCNFVIAVSVTAKMEKRFCNITRGTAHEEESEHHPDLLRSFQVQNHNLNSYGVGPADVVIAPDVTGCRRIDWYWQFPFVGTFLCHPRRADVAMRFRRIPSDH